MNLKISLITTCIIAFSPVALAQQNFSFGFVDTNNSILIAENRGGTSNETRGPKFRSHSMKDKDMIDAYQDNKMDEELKSLVDSEGYDRDTIHNKRA
ncbi:hypothetical protein VIN01S_23940 [Vibrio inusitatus NBRC 102082]|uniref:Uncharacterized protein n=1 Tax=Vibrio inusitatus NBRC 102082 TaxID=1219070 RepID=A0A4Y3HXZ9_9VIBR|nr:hypothetical protein [Vibrio inusitatus]GEA51590.1 hypothetical protein VIN01S_23940 [Vibrio inusitatus NBRC 102082]